MDTQVSSETPPRPAGAVVAVGAAAVDFYQEQLADTVRRFVAVAEVGPPAANEPSGIGLDLDVSDLPVRVTIAETLSGEYQLDIRAGGILRTIRVDVAGRHDDRLELVVDQQRFTARVRRGEGVRRVEVEEQSFDIERVGWPVLAAPFPALVAAECVAVGDRVTAGAPLVVLESMKLESIVRAPFDCWVRQIWVPRGTQVEAGQTLVAVEPAVTLPPPAWPRSVGQLEEVLGELDSTPSPRASSHLKGVLLGFDAAPAEAKVHLARHLAGRGPADVADEVELLDIYADLADLAAPDGGDGAGTAPRGGREAVYGLLGRRGLARHDGEADLADRVAAFLTRYRLDDLGAEPATDAACYRLFLADRRRPGISASIVGAVLEAWGSAPQTDPVFEACRVLARLARQGRAPQRIEDLARSLLSTWSISGDAAPRTRTGAPGHDEADLFRWDRFTVTSLSAAGGVRLYGCVDASGTDHRLVAVADVAGESLGELVNAAAADCLAAVRGHAAVSAGTKGPPLTHVWVRLEPGTDPVAVGEVALHDDLPLLSAGTDLTELVVSPPPNASGWTGLRLRCGPGGLVTRDVLTEPPGPVSPLEGREASVRKAHRRGLADPFELAKWLAGPGGAFTELDLDDSGALVAVDRPPGGHRAGIVVGRVSTPTTLHPEGVTRILLCGDPTRALGAVAEPECARIAAAIDLAERTGVPLEWFALSAGARISMDSGTENMDWVADVLRRIITFTQAGGEINIVVAGINVGAQPYWNAEATMLMHTRGILVMTPDSAMVLTGKRSLDFSGGVSAAEERGIGGYERIMGANGQAQYWAPDLAGAARILMAHYDYTYLGAGETGPRRATTSDPVDRDVTDYPHDLPGSDLKTVGDILRPESNPHRKQPFDIRTVIRAVADQDCRPLERWPDMADARTAVVMDARIAGHAVCMIGIESHPQPRTGPVPSDGPATFTAGTLFPRSSKKVARAINAASGNRPLVVLANLSGFDGSPDSMRALQLEYGAEIGRAVVNFAGPIVFCVIGRYHGGAFVVFSKRLHPGLTVLAVQGARASVIGGAPAANVVFGADVTRRTDADDRVASLRRDLGVTTGPESMVLRLELAAVRERVHADKMTEVATEFDRIHDVDRAVTVGSVDAVIPAHSLRPRIAAALERHPASAR